MTLFKKIFDTHSQSLEAGDAYAQSDAVSSDVFVLSPDLRGDDDLALPPEPSLAERAAQAQAQIEATQALRQPAPNSMPIPTSAPEVAPVRPLAADIEVPKSSQGRSGRRAARVKTRLLGFDAQESMAATDPLSEARAAPQAKAALFPAGWIVVVAGPGRGHAFALGTGVSLIGRGEDQAIRLDFGDTTVSRQNHAAIAFDEEQSTFFLGHGGKSNIIRLNDRPVLSTEEIRNGDLVRIGETTLRLVALCGADFQWNQADEQGQ
ncbi:MAG: FHA domain-containing protein [Sedimentitalea sp.]